MILRRIGDEKHWATKKSWHVISKETLSEYLCLYLLFPAVYHAIYLEDLTAAELTEKIAQLFNISPRQINQIFKQGPTGIHVLVSDEVRSFKKEKKFIL